MINQQRTIFLAEDDQDDCLMFHEALQEMKCKLEVVVSRDGTELMNNFDKKTPPIPYVLFLDLNMPEKNGFDCLKEIRQSDELQGMPIVILSTSRDEDQIRQAYQLGATYYMPKPTRFSHLVEGIEKILFSKLASINHAPSFSEFLLKY